MNNVVSMPDLCIVRASNELRESNDFVTFLNTPDGNVEMFYCTDALSLGMALKMLSGAFEAELSLCSAQEQADIMDVLEDTQLVGQ